MKKYIEFGIGNTWCVRTEIEDDEGSETEHRGIEHLRRVEGVYVRLRLGQTVIVVSTHEGVKKMRKGRRTFKLVFGIAGVCYRKLGYRDAGCLLLPDEPLEI